MFGFNGGKLTFEIMYNDICSSTNNYIQKRNKGNIKRETEKKIDSTPIK